MKAYKEQQESEESDRETALKSALVGMSFVTNEKGKKIPALKRTGISI